MNTTLSSIFLSLSLFLSLFIFTHFHFHFLCPLMLMLFYSSFCCCPSLFSHFHIRTHTYDTIHVVMRRFMLLGSHSIHIHISEGQFAINVCDSVLRTHTHTCIKEWTFHTLCAVHKFKFHSSSFFHRHRRRS